MVPTMLVAAINAAAAIAAGGFAMHSPPPPTVALARLPMSASDGWMIHRCGDARAATGATGAIDPACGRLLIREEAMTRTGRIGRAAAPVRRMTIGGDGGGIAWRLASAMLPALGGVVGPGGMGIGMGAELPFYRGARMNFHLAAPRDTRIAATHFAPETTVQARCTACWDESEALGAGLNGGRGAPSER